MKVPLEITFRNVRKTRKHEELIHEKTQKLEAFCDYINSCRISVEKRHIHQKIGRPFRVRLDITVPPGNNIIVDNNSNRGEKHTTLDREIRNAFNIAIRQLKELKQRQRYNVKKHPQKEAQAVVSKLFRSKDFGFLHTVDDRNVYFHRNSVLHEDFDKIHIGAGVRFSEEQGIEGPQATTVQIIDNR